MKIANYIEGKIEEFRISGKTPSYLGLSAEVAEKLAAELEELIRFRKKEGVETDLSTVLLGKRVSEYMNLPVVTMSGSIMPADGIYIHDLNSPRIPHPFDGREDW